VQRNKIEKEERRSQSPLPDAAASARRLAANRSNAKRSTGPRTTRGKAQARRNALRHGLAAISLRNPAVSKQISRIVNAICDEGAPPLLREQALIIAESEVLLRHVRAARIRAVERVMTVEPTPPTRVPQFPNIEEFLHALDQLDRGKPAAAARWCRSTTRALLAQQAKFEAAAARNTDGTGKEEPAVMAKDGEGAAPQARNDASPAIIHDDVDAMCRALSESNKLERYERRALSRRKRAIRKFDALRSQMSGWIDDTE